MEDDGSARGGSPISVIPLSWWKRYDAGENGMGTKDRLLQLLRTGKESWVSGGRLSGELSVSRAAISKHVRKLRQDGYRIDSAPGKGYRLTRTLDLILAEEIREGLSTTIFGQQEIVCFKQTDSTNHRARIRAGEGSPEGTLVVTEAQSQGRGRKGRQWFSPEGTGIYLSLILRPKISPAHAPCMTLMTAVALADALTSLLPLAITIKWPNDILVKGRKLAGILTEISTDMDSVDYIVAGLGVNVNTPMAMFPAPLKPVATSILRETGAFFPRVRLIQAFLREFERCYHCFGMGDFQSVMARWKHYADIIGRRIQVEMIDRRLRGEVVDVGHDGVLILKDDRHQRHRIFSGDVSLLGRIVPPESLAGSS